MRHLFDGDHGGRSASYFLVDVPEGEPVLGGTEAEEHGPENSYQPLWATAPELEMLGLLPEEVVPLVVDAAWPLTVAAADADDWPVVERAVAALPARPVGVPALRSRARRHLRPGRLHVVRRLARTASRISPGSATCRAGSRSCGSGEGATVGRWGSSS